jgi:iron complex transport system substrate-binding protein
VSVPVSPKRIVSLAPAITEILFASGAGAQVVGVTRFCNFPKETDALREVGGFADPDVELVAQLAPDLVIATADTVTRERFDALVSLGIPVYATDASDFAGVAASIRGVSAAAGRAEGGETVAAEFERRLAAVKARVAGRAPRRTLVLFQADPAIAAGRDTFLDELVRLAGGENVAASAPTSYPRLGLEGIIALKPEILLTTMPQTAESLRKQLAGSPLAGNRTPT